MPEDWSAKLCKHVGFATCTHHHIRDASDISMLGLCSRCDVYNVYTYIYMYIYIYIFMYQHTVDGIGT